MKNFFFIAIVVGMCDSCESQSSEESGFRPFGIIDKRDAALDYGCFNLNSICYRNLNY